MPLTMFTLLNACIVSGKACIVILSLCLARGLTWAIYTLVVAPPFDRLKELPGPDGRFFEDHLNDVMEPTITPELHEKWVKPFGKTVRFHGFGRHDYRLWSVDFRVVSHVLNSPNYEKPWQTRSLLSRLLGRGVFAMEGPEHRLQRKLIAPAFTTRSIKAMTPIFFQKAHELRDRWDHLISQSSRQPNDSASMTIDVLHWLSRATFDVIGLAGFDYNFHSLQDESNEMYLAYKEMFAIADKGLFKTLIQLYLPWFEKFFPDATDKITHACLRTIQRNGAKIIQEKKAVTLAEKFCARNDNWHKDLNNRDILSLLIKANLSSDPCTRMTDADLLDQLSTFLFAGSDSTSVAMAWCIHFLSQNIEFQDHLRQELLSLPTPSSSPVDLASPPLPTSGDDDYLPSPCAGFPNVHRESAYVDAIDALPFLDAVIRETLRFCPPAHSTIRVATRTDSIPVSSPVRLRNGAVIPPGGTITIGKGSFIHIPMEGLNLSPEVWGENAGVFDPNRWFNLPKTARPPSNPGLANMMTFSFGPHSCPGWKFTLLEMKLFMATLIRHFTFEPEESIRIRMRGGILTRPHVDDQLELGAQLPVRVRRYFTT